MFDLNPLAQSNAWWQHMVMILGAGIIGYIIGYRKSRGLAIQLENELGNLNVRLDDCRNTVVEVPAKEPTIPFAAEIQSAAAIVPLPVVTAEPVTPDDLKVIEGIGPKIEQLLNNDGIMTFSQLSNTPSETIVRILRAAGPRFQMHDPGTWPQQAALAAAEKWDELKELQTVLNKGRNA